MAARRLTLTEAQLVVLVEALREALAAELLAPASIATARELLELLDAKLPNAVDRHPAGPVAGRLVAGDEILRLLHGREERDGHARLTREQLAAELAWKPAGVSVRQLLEELRRAGWLVGHGKGPDRRYQLTAKGRGRARELATAGAAPDGEARVHTAEQLLDLIYADARGAHSHTPATGDPYGLWHRPMVQAAARLTAGRLAELEAELRADGLVGEQIHSYGTLTEAGEALARERWFDQRPGPSLYRPPRLARPYRRADEVVARRRDRACPNCGWAASWLGRRGSKRFEELRGRGEVDYRCADCDVQWTIYLEPVDRAGQYQPGGDPAVCRPRWRYRSGWLRRDELAPPDHHPSYDGD